MSQEEEPTDLFHGNSSAQDGPAEASTASQMKMGLAGRTVAHYVLEKELGHGAQGYVYLATDKNLNRRVALKILIGGDLGSNAARLRFEREAEAASRLDDPGIASVFEVGEYNGLPYIAFEYVKGKTLATVISEAQLSTSGLEGETEIYLDFDSVVDGGEGITSSASQETGENISSSAGRDTILSAVLFVESAARAIHKAHEVGLVHRDLKPGNLMVREDGSACVLDFGLAKNENSVNLTLTQSGDIMGTPAYMSPEQVLAQHKKIDRRTDIYSLGVTLFEACTLKRPFYADSRHALFQAIANQEPPSPRSINPKVPRDLASIILTAIDKDPDRRYVTAQDFAEDLKRFIDRVPVHARPASAVTKTVRLVQRNPVVSALSALSVIALVALVIVFYTKNKEAEVNLAVARDENRAKTEALARESRERMAKNTALEGKTAALADMERLADVRKLEQAVTRAADLFPLRPEKVAEIEEWIKEYKPLATRLPAHRASLEKLRATALPFDEEAHRQRFKKELAHLQNLRDKKSHIEGRLNDPIILDPVKMKMREQITKLESEIEEAAAAISNDKSPNFGGDALKLWKFDVLSDLVANLTEFCDPKTGTIQSVERRLVAAKKIYGRTVTEHQAAWDETIAYVASHPPFRGFKLLPQVGFVPLGTDPRSKLPEFLHIESHTGPVPKRDADGNVPMTASTGMILVLLPAGEFWYGSQCQDPKKPNYAPDCDPKQTVTKEVIIEPFLIGKYEVTQAQWWRNSLGSGNPSYYKNGWKFELHKGEVTWINPVEQVSQKMCEVHLARVGLVMPTQVQWEYAARAGTQTPWPCGVDKVEDLQKYGNIAGNEAKAVYAPFEPSIDDGYLVHAPVGQFAPNAFGLYDVIGNVTEWTSSMSPIGTAVACGGNYSANRLESLLSDTSPTTSDLRTTIIGVRAASLLQNRR